MTSQEGIWYQQEFRLYLGSTAFSGIAFAMQQLLLSWILIGILELPATQVGIIQAAVGIPGLFVMLLGGARADDRDPRNLLIKVYSYSPLFPLFLILVVNFDHLLSLLAGSISQSRSSIMEAVGMLCCAPILRHARLAPTDARVSASGSAAPKSSAAANTPAKVSPAPTVSIA